MHSQLYSAPLLATCKELKGIQSTEASTAGFIKMCIHMEEVNCPLNKPVPEFLDFAPMTILHFF